MASPRSADDDPADGGTGAEDAASEDPDESGPSAGASHRSRDGTVAALRDRVPDRLVADATVVHVVAAIALLAVLARLVFLGDRVAHWDEARVAYWIDFYREQGSFAYRHIIHGPLIQHVNRFLFGVLGTNDFVMRVPLALVGGLLPLSALLFREHLEDDETIALSLFLAFNAVLLYYSRFMRSDVLVAAFMFTALGLLVRFYDTRRWRYVYGAAVFVALGFGSKENAIVYVLTWVGAAVLLADTALFRPRSAATGWTTVKSKLGGLSWWTPVRYVAHGAGAAVAFLAVIVYIYAPRGLGEEGLRTSPNPENAPITLWEAVGDPAKLPAMVSSTLSHAWDEFMEWFGPASDPGCYQDNLIDAYSCFFTQYVEVMFDAAAVVTLLAVGGFVLERYGRSGGRGLVMFGAYAGFVSVLGYPAGTDVFGAWIVVHAVVPLAIPAAVGLAAAYRWGTTAMAEADSTYDDLEILAITVLLSVAGVFLGPILYRSFVSGLAAGDLEGLAASGLVAAAIVVGIVALYHLDRDRDRNVGPEAAAVALTILVLSSAFVGLAAVDNVYRHTGSDGNALVQYGQPADDPRPALSAMDRIARENPTEPDVVVFYGETGEAFDADREAIVKEDPANATSYLNFEPICTNWFNLLPVPWYFAASDATVDCERDAGQLGDLADSPSAPPMIITRQSDSTVPDDALSATYESHTYQMRTSGSRFTFWIHEDWVEG